MARAPAVRPARWNCCWRGRLGQTAEERNANPTSGRGTPWAHVTRGGSFLHRLRAFLEQAGLGERIGPEIEAANERVRAYDEKWRKRRGEDSPPRF